jgi:hypothetical protein
MTLTRSHEQGDDLHLTTQQAEAVTRTADHDLPGLVPATTQYEGMWFNVPRRSQDPGRAGMRAFSLNWFYYHNGTIWKRARLYDF